MCGAIRLHDFSCPVRTRLIEQLTREIQILKDELESFRLEVKRPLTSGELLTSS